MSATVIEQKLATVLLGKSTVTEAEVVYVLVEITKHFEREKFEKTPRPGDKSFPFISFFRDWAVHGTIHNPEHGQRALQMHDNFGADRVYDEMVNSLMDEITRSAVMSIPASLNSSFKTSLYSVIEDVPIDISASALRLIAKNDGSIQKEVIS
jgi:hypothetical protein